MIILASHASRLMQPFNLTNVPNGRKTLLSQLEIGKDIAKNERLKKHCKLSGSSMGKYRFTFSI